MIFNFFVQKNGESYKRPSDCVATHKCPKPECKANIYIQPTDKPGEYQCGCHACSFILAEDQTVELKKK